MVTQQLTGICAVAVLVALAAACRCTSAGGEPQEGMGVPQMNGTVPGERGQPPANGTAPEGHQQPQMDFASAAAALGVTEEELRAALPRSPGSRD